MYSESIGNRTWTAPDEMTTEFEVAEFIDALVRLVKPQCAIETGCYEGEATVKIAQAMMWNGGKIFHTCDTDNERVSATMRRILDGPAIEEYNRAYRRIMSFNTMTGAQMISEIVDEPIDFAFLDSGGNRFEEAQALLPKLSEGAYVVIHDSRRPTEQAAILYLQEHAKTETLTFDTPRGCAVLRVWGK